MDKHNLIITKAKDHKVPAFQNLQQFYEFEFSVITKEKTNEKGFFDSEHIKETYWSKEGTDIYLLYDEETPIGFAVVNLSSMVNQDKNVKDIADFFIMPSYRNNCVGEWFAHKIFSLYKGPWEVRQFDFLHKATKFWRKSIQSYTDNQFEEFSYFDPKWSENLIIQKFIS